MAVKGEYLKELVAELNRAAANHYDADRICRFWSELLGWASIVLASLVGSAFVKDFIPTWIYGILGVASAMFGLAAKLKDKDYLDRAQKHKDAGQQFLDLRDRASYFVGCESQPPDVEKKVEGIISDKGQATKAAPTLPAYVFHLGWRGRILVVACVSVVGLGTLISLPIYLARRSNDNAEDRSPRTNALRF
jgi:hypothetical protein